MIDLNKSVESFAVFETVAWGLAGFCFVLFAVGLFWSSWILMLLGVVGIAIFVYARFIEPRTLKVSIYKEALDENPKIWLRIVFISDIHADETTGYKAMHRLADKIRTLKPDVLIIGGDAVVYASKDAGRLGPLADLEPYCGTFFVLGNHDYLDNPMEIRDRFLSWEWKDLTNTEIIIKTQKTEFRLAGVDDTLLGKPEITSKEIKPHILVSHNPDMVMDLSNGSAGLVLSGHTHGGQVALPFFGALHVPNKIDKKFAAGRHEINENKIIISKGLGQVGTRVRFGAVPEIVVVEAGIN